MPTRLSAALAVFLLLLAAPPDARAGGGPENVLVVVNDESSESLEVAQCYVHARDIPRHHVLHLRFQPRQWKRLASFEEYETLLEKPVRAWLKAHPKAHITTILLCRDVPLVAPLKLPADGKKPRDFHKGTAHLLATMDVTSPVVRDAAQTHVGNLGKWGFSPYYAKAVSIDPRRPIKPGWPLYVVGTLNAFTVADVRKMVANAITAETKSPRAGTVYLGKSRKGDPRGGYNPNFPRMQQVLQQAKFKCEIVEWSKDKRLLTDKHDVLFYMFGQAGWDKTFPAANTYLPGAVVDNLTSVALTPNSFNPKAGGQTSMCHFLAAGASAVHGCVREPYTVAFDPRHTHIFRYLDGYNVAESFYLSHRLMPWMNLVAGDPLMQPLAQRPTLTHTRDGAVLTVKAEATRQGASVAELRLYVNGALRDTATGATATFDLAGVDTRIDHVVVVAIDDAPQRTQGRLLVGPPPSTGDASKIAFAGLKNGKLRFDLGQRTRYSWYAPASTTPFGTASGDVLELTLGRKTALRNTVEIWLRTAPDAPPQVRFFDLQATLVTSLMEQAASAQKAGDIPALLRAVAALEGVELDDAQQAKVQSWKTGADASMRAAWSKLEGSLPRTLQPRHVEALREFATRYDGLPVADQARARLKTALAAVDAQAAPLLQRARDERARKAWNKAVDTLEELIKRYPASNHAETARAELKAIRADPAAKNALAQGKREEAAERMWKMAQNWKRNRQTARYHQMLRDLIEKYPGTRAAQRAQDELDGM